MFRHVDASHQARMAVMAISSGDLGSALFHARQAKNASHYNGDSGDSNPTVGPDELIACSISDLKDQAASALTRGYYPVAIVCLKEAIHRS
ncbi:MAG: hypothetical protein ABSC42_17410 [Tepidisphaeraceae bacterium]|jgi:hypothetical protein